LVPWPVCSARRWERTTSPASASLHFAWKETVLVGDHQERMERFRAALLARPVDEDAFTALRRTIVQSVPTSAPEVEELALAARLMVQSPQLLALVAGDNAVQEATIAEAIAEREGIAANAMYPALLAAFSGTAIRIGLTTWYTEGRVRPPAEVVDDIVASLGKGFAPQGAIFRAWRRGPPTRDNLSCGERRSTRQCLGA
jgi:hypothetical protein